MYPKQIYENNNYVDDFKVVSHKLKLYNNKCNFKECYNNKNIKDYDNLNMINVRRNYGFKYKNLNIYQEKLSDSGNKDERCYLKSFNSQK